jgi:hypothetical protein
MDGVAATGDDEAAPPLNGNNFRRHVCYVRLRAVWFKYISNGADMPSRHGVGYADQKMWAMPIKKSSI